MKRQRAHHARREFLASLGGAALGAPFLLGSAGPGARSFPPDQLEGEAFWKQVREEFLIPRDEAFFNTGTLGSSPRVVLQAVIDHMTHVDSTIAHWDYRPEHPDYFTGYRPEAELRGRIAELVGAEADEIALTINATMGMNLVANGLDLAPGDEILMTDQEHPGGRTGWELRAKRHGCFVKQLHVPLPPESPEQLVKLFADAITPQTKVIAVPHITSALAIVFPVADICRMARERGIITVVDGAQVAGHMKLDVRRIGCDFYFSSPHKWLLAPKGCGFLYVRRERLDKIWCTLASTNWDNYKEGAYRLMQWGSGNLSLLKGFDAALEFHRTLGPARVYGRIRSLADGLRDELGRMPRVTIMSPRHADLICATTTWRMEGYTGPQLMDELWSRARVRVRSIGETDVRQCCHIYTLRDDVDRSLEVLRALSA